MPNIKKAILAPCPFCGSKKIKGFSEGANWHPGIECKGCGINVYFFKKGTNLGIVESAEAVHKAWNRRPK